MHRYQELNYYWCHNLHINFNFKISFIVMCTRCKLNKFISVYSNISPTILDIQRHMHLRPIIIFSWHDLIRFGMLNIFSLKKVRNFFGFSFFSRLFSLQLCLHKCIIFLKKDANLNNRQIHIGQKIMTVLPI